MRAARRAPASQITVTVAIADSGRRRAGGRRGPEQSSCERRRPGAMRAKRSPKGTHLADERDC